MKKRRNRRSGKGLLLGTVLLAAAVSVKVSGMQLGGFEIQVGGKEEELDTGSEAREQEEKEPSPVQEPSQEFSDVEPAETQPPAQSREPERDSAAEPPAVSQTEEVQIGDSWQVSPENAQDDMQAKETESFFADEEEAANSRTKEAQITESPRPTASPAPTAVPSVPDGRREKKAERKSGGKDVSEEVFRRQIQVRKGERMVQLSFRSTQDWYMYSFQINGQEVFYHWEGSWATAGEISWQEGANSIEAAVRTGDGKLYLMDPWMVFFRK